MYGTKKSKESARRAPGDNGCLPFIKKFRKFWLRIFWSVRTVRVVYHLPKISGLSRRARLDSSYNMKMVRNSRNL